MGKYDHLRELVLAAIDEGRSISEAHRLYKVSRPTIYRWLKRRAGGEPLAKPKGKPKGKGKGPRKPNEELVDAALDDVHDKLRIEFRRFIRRNNPDLSRYSLDKLALDRHSFLIWLNEKLAAKVREGFVADAAKRMD